jgi:hypothetical protein
MILRRLPPVPRRRLVITSSSHGGEPALTRSPTSPARSSALTDVRPTGPPDVPRASLFHRGRMTRCEQSTRRHARSPCRWTGLDLPTAERRSPGILTRWCGPSRSQPRSRHRAPSIRQHPTGCIRPAGPDVPGQSRCRLPVDAFQSLPVPCRSASTPTGGIRSPLPILGMPVGPPTSPPAGADGLSTLGRSATPGVVLQFDQHGGSSVNRDFAGGRPASHRVPLICSPSTGDYSAVPAVGPPTCSCTAAGPQTSQRGYGLSQFGRARPVTSVACRRVRWIYPTYADCRRGCPASPPAVDYPRSPPTSSTDGRHLQVGPLFSGATRRHQHPGWTKALYRSPVPAADYSIATAGGPPWSSDVRPPALLVRRLSPVADQVTTNPRHHFDQSASVAQRWLDRYPYRRYDKVRRHSRRLVDRPSPPTDVRAGSPPTSPPRGGPGIPSGRRALGFTADIESDQPPLTHR